MSRLFGCPRVFFFFCRGSNGGLSFLLLNLLEVLATRSFYRGFFVLCKARFCVDGRGAVDRVKGFSDGWQ